MTDEQPSKVRYLIVAAATLMAFLLYLDRFCVSFAVDYIRQDLDLSQEADQLVSECLLLVLCPGSGTVGMAERPLRGSDHALHLHPHLVTVHRPDRSVDHVLHVAGDQTGHWSRAGGCVSNRRVGRRTLGSADCTRNSERDGR